MNNFKQTLIKDYCWSLSSYRFDEKALESEISKAVRNGKVMLAYKAKVDNKRDLIERKDLSFEWKPFGRVSNLTDRANLIYLATMLCDKTKYGAFNVNFEMINQDDSEDEEERQERLAMVYEMGGDPEANCMYIFRLMPSFHFES